MIGRIAPLSKTGRGPWRGNRVLAAGVVPY
jgi:hypothetical protein